MNVSVTVHQLSESKSYLNVIEKVYNGVGVWSHNYKAYTVLITSGWHFSLIQFDDKECFLWYVEVNDLDLNTVLVLTEEGWKPYHKTLITD